MALIMSWQAPAARRGGDSDYAMRMPIGSGAPLEAHKRETLVGADGFEFVATRLQKLIKGSCLMIGLAEFVEVDVSAYPDLWREMSQDVAGRRIDIRIEIDHQNVVPWRPVPRQRLIKPAFVELDSSIVYDRYGSRRIKIALAPATAVFGQAFETIEPMQMGIRVASARVTKSGCCHLDRPELEIENSSISDFRITGAQTSSRRSTRCLKVKPCSLIHRPTFT
jgi:hypothetical protein